MDCLPEVLLMAENHTCHEASKELTKQGQVAIHVLSEEVLLEIFDFYIHQARRRHPVEGTEAWLVLVHMCRYWRNIVFGSPLCLNLQLLCTAKTRVRMLGVWPALPIRIRDYGETRNLESIIAVLKHSDRICDIALYESPNWLLEKVIAALTREPFPALTKLEIVSYPGTVLAVLPDPFSGGSTPRLCHVWLDGIIFPELTKLLLSATQLVYLALSNIPHHGYASPEETVTCLSALTSLEKLHLEFQPPRSNPDREIQRPHLYARSVFPSLTTIGFRGFSEYLEDLVARIDAPRLSHLTMSFFDQFAFDTPQLVHFITRTPNLKAPDEAHMDFYEGVVNITYSSRTPGSGDLNVETYYGDCNRQLWFLAQVCSSFSLHLFTVEDLYIYKDQNLESDWQDDDFKNTHWLEIIRPFTTVKNLYLCKQFAPRVAPALQEIAKEGTTEVLPILQNIFLEAFQQSVPVHEGIGQFAAARQVSGYFIAISDWVRASQKGNESNESPVFAEFCHIYI